ncbi:MAG TPA: hypothetical protein VNJ12_00620 [Candidatus Dormibacteraeota bacterium]|nr:hypothetical protein [Candidatus Dormibacteraeota bacterium]
MTHLTRRELLQGLAAVPALAVAGSLAHAAQALSGQFTGSPFQQLNVLVHGMSVIEFASDEVYIYLPSAPSDYAYLAGSWMQEASLARGGAYRLSGVMTGPRPELRMIHPEENAVYKDHKIDPGFSYCKLILPFPDLFTPLRLLRKEHGRNFFAGSPQPILEPSAIPQVVALTYSHPDSTSPLEVRPLAWTPVIQEGVVNFHVWDAPAKTPSPQEARDAFANMTKMIGLPGLRLNPDYAEIKPAPPDENPDVLGLGCEEEWTLIERLGHPYGCVRRREQTPKKGPFDNLSLILY